MVFSIDPDRYRIVDLSYLVVPPGTRERPYVVQRGRLADQAYKFDIVRTHTHVGTHVETPAHFFPDGKIDLSQPTIRPIPESQSGPRHKGATAQRRKAVEAG